MPLLSLTQYQIHLLDRIINTKSVRAFSVTHMKVTFQIQDLTQFNKEDCTN